MCVSVSVPVFVRSLFMCLRDDFRELPLMEFGDVPLV